MKDEIRRIMNLVKEGKLSPEDAAELIEAFQTSPAEEEDSSPPKVESESAKQQGAKNEPFQSFIDAVERLGKDVSSAVDWNDVAQKIKVGAKKGFESLKDAVDQAKLGKFTFGIWTSAEEKTVSLPLMIPEGKTLRIENVAGDVRVFGGDVANEVTARAVIRGSDAEDAKQKAERYTLIIEESDHLVIIRQPDINGLAVDLDVKISTNAPVEIKVDAGDIEVHNTKAGVRINGHSGSVRVSGIQGLAEIETTSGDVTVNESELSTLNIENKSGDVDIVDTKANISIRSTSGHVKLEETSGKTLSIEAVSGSIDLDLNEPVEGTVNVRTVNGDVNLGIADGSNARVALATLRGDVKCELAIEDEAKDERRITGRLGKGDGTIDVSAVNGDINLRLRNHATL